MRQLILLFIHIYEFIRCGVLCERNQKFSADIFTTVFVQKDLVTFFFYLSDDGTFNIIIAIRDSLLKILKGFAFMFSDMFKIILFHSQRIMIDKKDPLCYRP